MRKQRKKESNLPNTGLNLKTIFPKTSNQKLLFSLYYEGKNLFLKGHAGTGKSFVSLYLSLEQILSRTSEFHRLIIIRSAQSSKNMGFLPGNKEEKMKAYEVPYKSICSQLFGRDDAYEVLKQRGIIEFESTSFLRGTTLDNSIIIFDEAQNSSYGEFRTVITRIGENSRAIFCGDNLQDDLTSERYNEISGFDRIERVFSKMSDIDVVEFDVNDVVRSGFVKDFLIAEGKI